MLQQLLQQLFHQLLQQLLHPLLQQLANDLLQKLALSRCVPAIADKWLPLQNCSPHLPEQRLTGRASPRG